MWMGFAAIHAGTILQMRHEVPKVSHHNNSTPLWLSKGLSALHLKDISQEILWQVLWHFAREMLETDPLHSSSWRLQTLWLSHTIAGSGSTCFTGWCSSTKKTTQNWRLSFPPSMPRLLPVICNSQSSPKSVGHLWHGLETCKHV